MFTIFLSLPYRKTVLVSTDCSVLKENLILNYGKYAHENEYCNADMYFTITKSNSRYLFSFNDESYYTESPLSQVNRLLVSCDIFSDNILALHGGAVEYKGEAYVFLAPTTCGKTTLTAYLSSVGLGYITDDCVIISKSDLKVHPHTTPLHLRDGGADILKKMNLLPDYVSTLEDGKQFNRLVYTPANLVDTALPLKKNFFIERSDTKNEILPMSTTERITELMKSPIVSYDITGEYIKLFINLSHADCARLIYKDMEYVKEIIKNEH